MKKTIVFIFTSLVFQVWGQDTINISQSELEQRLLDQNLQVVLAQKEAELAKAELLATRAMYLPNISTSYTVMGTNSPLNAFGFKLNQSRISMEDFNPDLLNKPKGIIDFGPKIEVQQPLINMDAVFQKKAGEIKSDVLKMKKDRTEEYIQFEIRKAYMMLQLAYKMGTVLKEAEKTVLANQSMIEDFYAEGMVQKADVLDMEVRVNEISSQIQMSKSAIQNASDYLFLLLNENSENKIFLPEEELEIQMPIAEKTMIINPDRKDLRAYRKSLEAYDWLIKSSRSKFLPRLNAFGSYEMHDHKLHRLRGKGYLVGLQLSWNVFDGLQSKSEQAVYTAQKEKARVEIDQYTQQSELELRKAVRQIEDAEKQVRFAESAWEQSRESYRIRADRYRQGLEKSTDLLNAETLMSQKELEYQQTVFEYNTALEYYQFLK